MDPFGDFRDGSNTVSPGVIEMNEEMIRNMNIVFLPYDSEQVASVRRRLFPSGEELLTKNTPEEAIPVNELGIGLDSQNHKELNKNNIHDEERIVQEQVKGNAIVQGNEIVRQYEIINENQLVEENGIVQRIETDRQYEVIVGEDGLSDENGIDQGNEIVGQYDILGENGILGGNGMVQGNENVRQYEIGGEDSLVEGNGIVPRNGLARQYEIFGEDGLFEDNGNVQGNAIVMQNEIIGEDGVAEEHEIAGQYEIIHGDGIVGEDNERMADNDNKIKKNYKKKKEFCKYCKLLKTNLARHFEMMHDKESEVQTFLQYDKKSLERKNLISKLRNEGNFSYNYCSEASDRIPKILSRQKNNAKTSVTDHYLPCPNCKVTIAQTSLRRHHRTCILSIPTTKTRSVIRESRNLVTKIHPVADEIMITEVIPPMQRDKIFETLIQDRMIIMYGNHFTPKYNKMRQYIIRNKMRMLSRVLRKVKKMNPKIQTLEELLIPQNFEYAMKGIKKIAGFKANQFAKPKLALTAVHDLIICCNILLSLYIKEDKPQALKKVKKFLHLLRTDAPGKINKPAHNDLCEFRRKKLLTQTNVLPLSEDITQFQSYLLQNGKRTFRALEREGFTFEKWTKLCEISLLYLVSFNRKRAGEARNILLEDFYSVQRLSNTSLPELFEELNDDEKSTAESYYKLTIRGKLDRNVDLLIPGQIKEFLDYVCSHRTEANIPEDNSFLFAMPGKMSGRRQKSMDTCKLMRKYTFEANLKEPEKVRTSLLRKHLATKVSTLGLQDSEQDTVQNFMGHEGHIHKKWYRQQVVKKDLMMAKILIGSGKDPFQDDQPHQMTTTSSNVDDVHSNGANISDNQQFENSNHEQYDDDTNQYDDDTNQYDGTKTVMPDAKQKYSVRDPVVLLSPIKIINQTPRKNKKRQQAERRFKKLSTPQKKRKADDDNYVVDHESSEDDTDQEDSSEYECLKKNTKRQGRHLANQPQQQFPITPIKKIRNCGERRAWITPERKAIKQCWGNYITNGKLPSYGEIRKAQSQYPALVGRSLATIKAHISNEIRRRASLTSF